MGAAYRASRIAAIGTPKTTHTPAYERLVRLLVEAREKAGLTQRDVAGRLGVPHSFVAKVEMRERRIDVVEFVRIARALKADPARLFAEVARHVRG